MARIAIGDVIDAIYSAAAVSLSWSAALEEVAHYVGGSGAMIVHNNLEQNSGAIISGGLREDLSDLYVREYCRNPKRRPSRSALPTGSAGVRCGTSAQLPMKTMRSGSWSNG